MFLDVLNFMLHESQLSEAKRTPNTLMKSFSVSHLYICEIFFLTINFNIKKPSLTRKNAQFQYNPHSLSVFKRV